MIRLGKERDSLGVVFDQIGTPTYANDLARAIYAIINKGIVRGIYHFSNEGVCSWYDFTVAIHRSGRNNLLQSETFAYSRISCESKPSGIFRA